MANHTIFIGEDGLTKGIASPLTEALCLRDRERVSRVEPVNPVLRFLFYAIRKRVRDDSALAKFTRSWPCLWQARIFNGPTLGPFQKRETAISVEIDWMNTSFER